MKIIVHTVENTHPAGVISIGYLSDILPTFDLNNAYNKFFFSIKKFKILI